MNAGLQTAEELRSGGEGEPNSVSSTTPSAGERMARGIEVVLTVVPIVTVIAVPYLTGATSRAARETIDQAVLTVGRVRTAFDDLRPPFVVLCQSPAAGERDDLLRGKPARWAEASDALGALADADVDADVRERVAEWLRDATDEELHFLRPYELSNAARASRMLRARVVWHPLPLDSSVTFGSYSGKRAA
jgi:hypothetical protein